MFTSGHDARKWRGGGGREGSGRSTPDPVRCPKLRPRGAPSTERCGPAQGEGGQTFPLTIVWGGLALVYFVYLYFTLCPYRVQCDSECVRFSRYY